VLVSIGLHPTEDDVMGKTKATDPFVEPERRLERSFLPTDSGEEAGTTNDLTFRTS